MRPPLAHTSHPPGRRLPRVGILTLTLATTLLATGVARAQEEPGPVPAGEDAELRALREAAEREAEAASPGNRPRPDFGDDDDAELRALRADAELAATDDDPTPARPFAGASTAAAGFFSRSVERLNAFNPRLTVIGDFLGRVALGHDKNIEVDDDGNPFQLDNKFRLREVELDLRADIDPYAKGVVILAFENEVGGDNFEAVVEEGYATIEALPFDIPTFNFRARVGRFRTRFGRANTLHLHDLMWTEYPLVVQDFLGEEGDVQDGVELRWLAPGVPIEISGSVINGENDTILADTASEDPAYTARVEGFIELGETTFLSIGGSFYFGFADADAEQEVKLSGFDVLFKWAPDRYNSIALLGELFYLDREINAGDDEDHAWGGYFACQFQPGLQWLYIGARFDYSDYLDQTQDNDQWAASAYVSIYTTEFLRLRVGVEHRERSSTMGGDPDIDTLFVQLTFIFGSHPVEPFWFNR